MRNGDFAPSRIEAEREAINLLFGAKINSHPESTVGLLTMADKYVAGGERKEEESEEPKNRYKRDQRN